MGLPDDDFDELVRSTLTVNQLLPGGDSQAVRLLAEFDTISESRRRRRWSEPYASSPQWFPYVGNGSTLSRRDYDNLVRWQNVLNKRVKGATFDFLDDGAVATARQGDGDRGVVEATSGGPMKALLVQPPVYDTQYYAEWSMPSGLLKVATWLRELGYDLRLVDCLYPDAKGEVKQEIRKVVQVCSTIEWPLGGLSRDGQGAVSAGRLSSSHPTIATSLSSEFRCIGLRSS